MKRIMSLLLAVVLACTMCACEKSNNQDEISADRTEEEELRVYSLILSPEGDIQIDVIDRFENMHPGYKVHWEVGVSEKDGITIQDAIRNLNAEMMAGNGPDVLLLDGLPISDYIEKGLLADVSGILDNLQNNGEVFFEKVLSAYKKDGKVCAVPSMFSVPIVVGDEKFVQAETIHDFTEILSQKTNDSAPVLHEYLVEEFPIIFLTVWNEVFSGNQGVDKSALTEVLRDMKLIAEVSGFDKDLPEYEKYSPFDINPVWENYVGGWIPELVWDECQILMGSICTPFDCYSIKSAEKVKTIDYQYLSGKNGNMFQPKFVIGMNASTQKKAEAEKFIRFFLSSDLMAKPDAMEMFVSVNKKAFESKLPISEEEKEIGWTSNSDTHEEEDAYKLYYYELNPQEAQEILTFLDSADTMIDVDYLILQSVMDLVGDYIFEEETLENTVDKIAEKMEIYQAE